MICCQRWMGWLLGIVWVLGFPWLVRAATPTPTLTPTAARGAWVVTPQKVQWVAEVATPAEALAAARIPLPADAVLTVNGQPWKPSQPLPSAGWAVVQVQPVTKVVATVDGASMPITALAASSVGEALWRTGVTLHEADRLTPAPWKPLGSTAKIVLKRAVRLTVRVGQHTFPLTTAAPTVGQALAAVNLAPQGLETTTPGDSASLSPKAKPVVLHRIWEKVVLRQLPVAFTSKTEARADLPLDTIKVVQAGQYGLQVQRVRVRYEEGQEIGRLVEDAWLARQPRPRIVGYGTKITIQTLQTPDGPVRCWRVLRVYATSYSPCRLGVDRCSDKTFSGATLRKGIVAVKRSWYHYMAGQKVYVPGYGFGTIADIGGGIPGRYWIDLGYTDSDYQSWHQWTTLCFVAPPPPPSQIPWILP